MFRNLNYESIFFILISEDNFFVSTGKCTIFTLQRKLHFGSQNAKLSYDLWQLRKARHFSTSAEQLRVEIMRMRKPHGVWSNERKSDGRLG